MFQSNSSRYALAVALATLFLLLAACANKPKAGGVLTEQKILATLDEIDRAALKKDADAIAGYFSEYAQIKMKVNGFGMGKQSMTFDRKQYVDYAKQSFAVVQNYEYERKNMVIKIAPDGQSAIVTDQVFENATTRGRSFRAVTEETASFKMEDGKVVLAYLEGDMREN